VDVAFFFGGGGINLIFSSRRELKKEEGILGLEQISLPTNFFFCIFLFINFTIYLIYLIYLIFKNNITTRYIQNIL